MVTRKKVAFLLAAVLILASAAGCGAKDMDDDDDTPDPSLSQKAEMPPEIKDLRERLTGMAETYAKRLDGKWGDSHAQMMASGQGRNFPGYAEMEATLRQFRTESGAYYVYALYSDAPETSPSYFITVDGSEDPDDWMEDYETEIQFKEAWGGTPSSARSAWDDDDDDPVWSAFAPIHDTSGKVVAILGIDYPAPEVRNFPQWNRDEDDWNHYDGD